MFAYNQALQEEAINSTIRDMVDDVNNKLAQDPKLSLDGMTDFLVSLINEKEEQNARQKVLITGIWSLDVDWDNLDFTYYHMAYRIIVVKHYAKSEYMSPEEFTTEELMLKDKCKKAYMERLVAYNK